MSLNFISISKSSADPSLQHQGRREGYQEEVNDVRLSTRSFLFIASTLRFVSIHRFVDMMTMHCMSLQQETSGH